MDAVEVASAIEGGIETLGAERLQALCELYTGELLEGLVIERCPEFNLWLTGQQSRYAAFRTALLQRLADSLPADSARGLAALEKWVEIAPLDNRAQIELLRRLAGRGRIDACKRQLAAAARLYQAEALDFEPVKGVAGSVRSAATGESEEGRRGAAGATSAWRRSGNRFESGASPLAGRDPQSLLSCRHICHGSTLSTPIPRCLRRGTPKGPPWVTECSACF